MTAGGGGTSPPAAPLVTVTEFAAALRAERERAGLSLRKLAERIDELSSRTGAVAITYQRLGEFTGTSRVRLPTEQQLRTILAACRTPRGHAGYLLSNRTRLDAATNQAPPRRPAEGVARVGDAWNWVRLGVHEPITLLADGTDLTDRVDDGHLPAYVLREADRLVLRPALHAAAIGQGPAVRLVVVVGESTAGKTRMAAEAARAELGDWELVVPGTPDDLTALHHPGAPHTTRRSTGVLVWLDEVQDLLARPGAVEAVQKLLSSPVGRVVLLASVRTDAERALEGSAGWRLLDRADLRVELHRRPRDPAELQRELDRAAELDDLWIREALAKLDGKYGIAEWLAAGPQLLRELGRARTGSDPVQRVAAAIVDAAVDCYRAGYTTPAPEPLLAEAHRLHLSPVDRTDPALDDPAVFTAALTWVRTRRVAGAVGLLVHHRGRGDRAFDYLLGHADRPGAPRVEPRLWPVLLRRVTPATTATIVRATRRHGHEAVALELSRRNPTKVNLLFEAGDVPGLARQADTGAPNAAERLAHLLLERADEPELIRLADAGDWRAAERLVGLLVERGDEPELARRADAGDEYAAERLVGLLVERLLAHVHGRVPRAGVVGRLRAVDRPPS